MNQEKHMYMTNKINSILEESFLLQKKKHKIRQLLLLLILIAGMFFIYKNAVIVEKKWLILSVMTWVLWLTISVLHIKYSAPEKIIINETMLDKQIPSCVLNIIYESPDIDQKYKLLIKNEIKEKNRITYHFLFLLDVKEIKNEGYEIL